MSMQYPLVVDLDGSLLRTDMLLETANFYLVRHPFGVFNLPLWLARGRVELKRYLAESTNIDVEVLPYNQVLLQWLKDQKASGRRIVLATASHKILAERVADKQVLFDEVIATDDGVNLKSHAKRDALVARYGDRGFDYVGNDWADLIVWKAARHAHVVGGSARLLNAVRAEGNLGRIFINDAPSVGVAMLQAIRPHQWLKNFLIFIPLLAAHRYLDAISVQQAMLAFVIFGLTASSVYLLNDLVDLPSDRHHLRKRMRPFAAGHLSLLHGWIAWPSLFSLAFAAAATWLPWRFVASLGLYFVLTVVYSLWLKRVAVLDVISLAALYTLRIVAGATAVVVPLSFWLLAFSMFLFLSLAFIKRYSELKVARDTGTEGALRGRAYEPQDLELVSSLGGSAGYLSVLVLALYIQDSHTIQLYAQPKWIWLACPLLLWWISRAWLIAHRGGMHEDPIIFAMKDRASWGVLFLLGLVFVMAKVAG